MHRTRPLGQPTRGKTALNRLRQVDVYIALAHSNALTGGVPLVVDLGYGAYPWTTLEMRKRWLCFNPRLRVLGVEIDPERVNAALAYAEPPGTDFTLGGFNLTTVLARLGEGRVRLIRAYNVLRQYDEGAVGEALNAMAAALETGGMLIEGTSNPTGRMVVFDVYQKTKAGLAHRELVFGTNFRAPVTPTDFQTILPKRLIHHALDERPARFFEDWRVGNALARGMGLRQERAVWRMAAWALRAKHNWPVSPAKRLTARGYVALRDPLLTPPGTAG